MLDQAFEALKTYDWGIDPKAIRGIDEAIVATHGDAEARKKLEARLAAVLATDVPQAAKDAVCRALRTIGTAASVPALAKLLHDDKLSHMARYALQVNSSTEATKALLGAIEKAPAKIRAGIASSIAGRARAGHKDASVSNVQALLSDKDPEVARAGAMTLGAIGTPDAMGPLAAVGKTHKDADVKIAIADAMLNCAENLLAAGNKAEAKRIYEAVIAMGLSDASKPAAEAGLKACA